MIDGIIIRPRACRDHVLLGLGQPDWNYCNLFHMAAAAQRVGVRIPALRGRLEDPLHDVFFSPIAIFIEVRIS